MSPDELKKLIQSDSEALALAVAGADDLCAARCREIAPKVTQETRVSELSILNLYANPIDAVTVLQTIEAVAKTNPVVGYVVKWLQPGAPGIDIGDARVRQLLVAPVNAGGVGLSAELAKPLLAAAEVAPEISGADVASTKLFQGNQGS